MAVWALVAILALAFMCPVFAADSEMSDVGRAASSLSVTRNSISFELSIDRALPPPKGTAVLLHGFPGQRLGMEGWEGQRALVASLVNAGYDVVRFNYVGSWGNAGQFSWFGGIEDTQAVLRALRTREAHNLGVDGSRIVLVGHSYGGWVALMTASRDSSIRCIATMASANMGLTGRLMRDDQHFHARRLAIYEEVLSTREPPIRAVSARALADDLIAHAAAWDLVGHVDQLRSKQLFFVSAENDSVVPRGVFVQPLLDGLLKSGAAIDSATIEGADHDFDQHGAHVNDAIRKWITTKCNL